MNPTLWECLRYPLADGPGWDCCSSSRRSSGCCRCRSSIIIAVLQPLTKGNWELGLMVVPVMIPVVFSFAMIFGYAIVFLGHVLVVELAG